MTSKRKHEQPKKRTPHYTGKNRMEGKSCSFCWPEVAKSADRRAEAKKMKTELARLAGIHAEEHDEQEEWFEYDSKDLDEESDHLMCSYHEGLEDRGDDG